MLNEYKKTEGPLTDDDIRILKKRRNASMYTLAVVAALGNIGFLIVFRDSLSADIFISTGIFTMFIGLIAYFIFKLYNKDLVIGLKFIVKGNVTDKRVKGGRSKSYEVTIGEDNIIVLKKEWNKINVGQKLEIHFSQSSRTALFIQDLTSLPFA